MYLEFSFVCYILNILLMFYLIQLLVLSAFYLFICLFFQIIEGKNSFPKKCLRLVYYGIMIIIE
jgi:hypothetical protein